MNICMQREVSKAMCKAIEFVSVLKHYLQPMSLDTHFHCTLNTQKTGHLYKSYTNHGFLSFCMFSVLQVLVKAYLGLTSLKFEFEN
jgi:hypothetical protein